MKKKYIKPEMQVYEVGTQQLLAGSGVDYYSGDAPDDRNDGMW
ncbi:MAG: hypothetical protein ACI3ZD_15655 [Prevotella sp.]